MLATSVTTASGASDAATARPARRGAPGTPVAGRAEDHEVGALERVRDVGRGAVDDAVGDAPDAGPSPDGDHAAIGQPAGSRRGADGARDRTPDQAEAEEGDLHGADRGAVSPSSRRCPTTRAASAGRRPGVDAVRRSPSPPLRHALRRARVVRRVLAPDRLALLAVASLVAQGGAAARTAPLLGEERLERRDRVDLPAAGPARESGIGPSVRPSAGRPARPRPSRAGTRSPRACRRGSARRPTGRSARGRTG